MDGIGDMIVTLVALVAFLAVSGACFLVGILLQYFGLHGAAPWSVGIGVAAGLFAASLSRRMFA